MKSFIFLLESQYLSILKIKKKKKHEIMSTFNNTLKIVGFVSFPLCYFRARICILLMIPATPFGGAGNLVTGRFVVVPFESG